MHIDGLAAAQRTSNLEIISKLKQTVQDQESIISTQQAKISKFEDKNAGMEQTIDQLKEEFAVKTEEAKESCESEKSHLREEFDLEILTREEERRSNESEQKQELERMRRKLQQCESTGLYMSNQTQNLVEAESENIDETKEEINEEHWIELDIKKLYIDVMNDMKVKFQNGDLNQDQKIAATGVILDTQDLLGRKSFEVLGLQIGDRNSAEIFEVLKGWKEAGNMTSGQNYAMESLAEDTQVRMIQGILRVFGYTPEQGAQSYNVSAGDLRLLLQRATFG